MSAKADGRPAVIQAQALLAEHEHDYTKALQLLRQAQAAAPGDVDIAFDRARIALEHPEAAQPTDLDDYLAADATTPDQMLLRAYILIARGRAHEALGVAKAVAQADGSNKEAMTLIDALSPSGASGSEGTEALANKAWAARFRLYGQYDTNVTVLPDHTATSTGGTQATVADTTALGLRRKAAGLGGEAELRFTPVRGITELSFMGGVSFLGHLNGRNDVNSTDSSNPGREGSKNFDYGTVDLQARLAFPRDRWSSALELDGSMVFIDDYAQRYLTDGTFLASTSYAAKSARALRIGAYGLGGLRDFGSSKTQDFSDRDGGRTEGGVTVDYVLSAVGFGVRGGYQAEITRKIAGGTGPRLFTENGATAMAYARTTLGRLDLLGAVTYQHRGYDTKNNAIQRTDDRFGPQLSAAFAITNNIAAVASYLYIHNASVVHGQPFDYSYQRHLVNVGLEARL